MQGSLPWKTSEPETEFGENWQKLNKAGGDIGEELLWKAEQHGVEQGHWNSKDNAQINLTHVTYRLEFPRNC